MKEIDSLQDFKKWAKAPKYEPAAFQSLNLKHHEKIILNNSFKGSLFLGCKMGKKAAGHISKTGGMVILNQKDFLFKTHRAFLYSPDELFKGFNINSSKGYKQTYDYKVYKEYVKTGMDNPNSILVSLNRRLHDHSITDALQEMIEGRNVVAIMGGHSMERQSPFYKKIALISRTLTRKGFLMVSGGGPGAMEATHLGTYFATKSKKELNQAIDILKIRPLNAIAGKEYADRDWLHRAWKVKTKFPLSKDKLKKSISIGIPTYLYGHEPPTLFATHIAKYFANSVREDGLLTIAKNGVIFAPGSAGTIQEIFQDATQNHYAPYNDKKKNKKQVSPMILFGKKRWQDEKPVWNLITTVAKGNVYDELLYLTDDVKTIVKTIVNYNPKDYLFPK